MKVMQIANFNGPASRLRHQEAPIPESGSGQITADVNHAGVGYVEVSFTEDPVVIDLPWTPGLEMNGRARALGDDVDGYQIGDVVVALTITGGSDYGQVVVAPTEFVTPLPAGLNPVLVAAAPTNSTMALAALEEIADLCRGESVLVHVVAGGLGSRMGQVARLLRVGRVVGVTRSEAKRQETLDLGYDEAWLAESLAEADPAQFDVVTDPMASPTRLRSLDLLRMGGRLLALGDISQEQDQQVSTTSLWLRGIDIIDFNLGAFSQADPGPVGGHLRRVVELVASRELRVHVTDHLPIQEAAQAIAAVYAGTTTDKIVLIHSQG